MRLVTFEIRAFRSIEKSTKLTVDERQTVILGANNEGKSNVLRALVVALESLKSLRTGTIVTLARQRSTKELRARVPRSTYDWDADYPVRLQQKEPIGKSVFDLEFQLTDAEITAFRKIVGSNLNGTLPVRLTLEPEYVVFYVPKRGRGAKALTNKARQIARFIGEYFDFQYIPAIRTSKHSMSVVSDMLTAALSSLEDNPEYSAALERVRELQMPVLEQLSQDIEATLKEFLPSIRSVTVEATPEQRRRVLSGSATVIIDDGSPTPLDAKGDGVQSLAAISLMRRPPAKGGLVVAIEEPETHLHPGAIRQLARVLRDLAQTHQLIITTHCPLLAQSGQVASNIIVRGSSVRPAKSVKDIRECLGVEVGDNLQAAEYVLVVEGEADVVALKALFEEHSQVLASALESRRLHIDHMDGGGSLVHRLALWRGLMCKPFVLVDDDQEGRSRADAAADAALIDKHRICMTCHPGLSESELEDWVDVALYSKSVSAKYGVDLSKKTFTRSRQKWSNRVKSEFKRSARRWTTAIEIDLKTIVAQAVDQNPASALCLACKEAFNAFIEALEAFIET